MSRGKSRPPPRSQPVLPAVQAPTPPRLRRRYALAVAAVVLATTAGVCWWALPPARIPATPTPPAVAAVRFVGSEACAVCHSTIYAAWKNSHHAHAMQEATAKTVLGNFADQTFRYAGVESTFFQRNDKYFVRTDGPDGKRSDFELSYTFGIAPLQQYLIALSRGRYQALSIAWDSRPSKHGGQRWFHLYPRDKVDHRDELHWTQRMQNWNFMCADCHSTEVKKNYEETSDTYRTTWKEISVGCEACHGPGSNHLDWSRKKTADAAKGLTVALAERAGVHWTIDATSGNATRSRPRGPDTEIEVCAQCHSRRGQIAEGYRAGLPFQDFYRPALLSPGLYYPDGQQRDEVYIWGSFMQSRMYHAGVTCSDCHDPHAEKVRAEGNALCAHCHLASKYDAPTHHHHPSGSTGARCAECHMPARTYMVVDPRRDHSLRIPRPDLTVTLGTPNACNGCHQDRDAKWAAATVEQWYGHQPQGFQQYAEALASAEQGAADAGPRLVRLAGDHSQPAIARASALEALAAYPAAATLEVARSGLTDHDALIRRASVGTLSMLPPPQRLPLLAPLLDDPIRTVRMESALELADAMVGADATQRAAFERAASEYEAALQFTSDRPDARAALGSFYMRQGRFDDSLVQFRSALALDPKFVPAYINLANVLRIQGRDVDGEQALREGLRLAPAAPALHHALGLTLVRVGRKTDALAELGRAAKLAPSDAPFAYVYAVALNSAGERAAALSEVNRALVLRPDDHDLLIAAVTFRRDSGDLAGARQSALRLVERYPDDPDAVQLKRELETAH
jgi:tetratricopeptide (TPR) repeat protein